jgi:hypothetical protein
MLLPRAHWISQLEAAGPCWSEFWDDPDRPDAVAAFLRSRIRWEEHADVFFISMQERAVQVPWGTFLCTWRSFLFSDEGPFLVRLGHPQFVFFPPTGMVYVGRRVGPEAPTWQ